LGLFLRNDTGGLLSVSGGAHEPFSVAAFGRQLAWYLRTLSGGLTPVGLILAGVGVAALRRRRLELAAWLSWALLPAVAYAAFAAGASRGDADYLYAIAARFHLLPMIGVAALAGFGAQALSERVRPTFAWGFAAAAFAGALARPVDLRGRAPTQAYARDLLAATKRGDALVLDSDDAIAALRFELREDRTARALLVPALAGHAPYRRELAADHPDLVAPEAFTDWRRWLEANRGRTFWAEGTLRAALERDLPGSVPDGPLIRLAARAPRGGAEDAARRFLESALGRLSKDELVDGTQEVVLARSGAALAHWHLQRVQAGQRSATPLQSSLGARLEAYW
jgi:hypothetical protein